MSTKIDGDSIHVQQVFKNLTITAISTAGNTTYTAAQLVNGGVARDANGSSRTDTTPTAAQLVSEMQSKNSAVTDGSSFRFIWANTSDGGAESITLSGGTGVTVHGETQIKRGRALEISCVATDTTVSSEAVDMYIFTNTEVV